MADESDLTGCLPFGWGPQVSGPIEQKYRELGGCVSFLGPPSHETRPTPDGRGGLFAAFANGSIYWHADFGAHVVRGEIRERWFALGAEREGLGYPISDETVLPDGGRYSVFEHGSIYWAPGFVGSPAFEVQGAIRDVWAQNGWERGPLGYPTSGEFDVPGGRQSNFQRGSIVWNRAQNTARAFF